MAQEGAESSVVTVKELAAVLQAMDQRYQGLFDAIRKQGESSKSETEAKDEVHPLQMPSVKLEGAESYASWPEHAETILVSRKLDGYILGKIEKPLDENSKEGQRWKATNALVRAWLLSSVSPQIGKQVERIKEASEIWRLLKGTFSGIGNEMLACKIQKELQNFCQGEKTVVEYISELKRMWSDLDYYDAIGLECGTCVEKYNKWVERRRVRDFLNGLNQKFENRRAALYGSTSALPSLEHAIAAILSEETRLTLEGSGSPISSITQGRSALLAAENSSVRRTWTNMSDRKCFECGEPGHIKTFCPELVGGGRGHGLEGNYRGRGRGLGTRGTGRGRGIRPFGRANVSTVEEEGSHTIHVQMTAEELEKWCRLKEAGAGKQLASEAMAATSSTSGAWDWKNAWDRESA